MPLLLKRGYARIFGKKALPKNARSTLPADLRRLKTLLLKLPINLLTVKPLTGNNRARTVTTIFNAMKSDVSPQS